MVEHGGGTIVNVASVGGVIAIADRAAYTWAKAAPSPSRGASPSTSPNRNPCQLRRAPGATQATGSSAGAGDAADDLRDQMRQRQIVNRLATAEEMAIAIVFLASPRSSFMQEATLVIDGGYSIRRSTRASSRS